jgi:hypothetical protein
LVADDISDTAKRIAVKMAEACGGCGLRRLNGSITGLAARTSYRLAARVGGRRGFKEPSGTCDSLPRTLGTCLAWGAFIDVPGQADGLSAAQRVAQARLFFT